MGWDSFDAAGKRVVTTPSTVVPCCRANRTATQSLTDSTLTPIQLSATDSYDTDSMHDPASNNTKITFNTAGVYVLTGLIQYDVSATGVRFIFFRINDTTNIGLVQVNAAGGGQNTSMTTCDAYKFAVTDFVELYGYQTSTGALNVTLAAMAAARVATG